MREYILLFCVLFTSFAQSNSTIEAFNINEDFAIESIERSIGLDRTCLDDYLIREKQLRKFLIWAPPITIVGAPASFFVGGMSAATISSLVGVTGWNGLGYTILGAVIPAVGTIGTFVALETIKAIQFSTTRKMTKLIIASHGGLIDSKPLKRFYRKYKRKYPRDSMSILDLANKVVELDKGGQLCDGSLTGKMNSLKLRKKLIKRKGLIKAIRNL